MPQHKLIYFNLMGRAEIIRWIYAYGGVSYTDERVEMADWPAKKPSIPGGKLPVLMVDNDCLPQSIAIARYAASEVGLVASDNLEAAYCDALGDTFSDLLGEYYKIKFMSDGTEEDKKTKLQNEFIPTFVKPILERLTKRLTGKQWFAGGKTTWADLFIGHLFCLLRQDDPSILKSYPVVAAHVEKVTNLPKIKEWLMKRPKCAM